MQFARPAEGSVAQLHEHLGRLPSVDKACEMEAEVRVYLRERSVPESTVAKELQQVLAEKARQGVTVAGKVV
ncbi:hypothetical protein D3C72_2115130 [compost metagenome]